MKTTWTPIELLVLLILNKLRNAQALAEHHESRDNEQAEDAADRSEEADRDTHGPAVESRKFPAGVFVFLPGSLGGWEWDYT